MLLPQARTEGVTIREMPQETLVFDRQTHKAHCLNAIAALVWKHCDGRTSVAELAQLLKTKLAVAESEAVVQLALEQLSRRQLLEQPVASPSPLGRKFRGGQSLTLTSMESVERIRG